MMTSHTEEEGPVTRAVHQRAPFGPMEHLGHERLVKEQQTSLESPRRRYSLSARLLFTIPPHICRASHARL